MLFLAHPKGVRQSRVTGSGATRGWIWGPAAQPTTTTPPGWRTDVGCGCGRARENTEPQPDAPAHVTAAADDAYSRPPPMGLVVRNDRPVKTQRTAKSLHSRFDGTHETCPRSWQSQELDAARSGRCDRTILGQTGSPRHPFGGARATHRQTKTTQHRKSGPVNPPHDDPPAAARFGRAVVAHQTKKHVREGVTRRSGEDQAPLPGRGDPGTGALELFYM